MKIEAFRNFDIMRSKQIINVLFENISDDIEFNMRTIDNPVKIYNGSKCENHIYQWEFNFKFRTTELNYLVDIPKLINDNYFILDGNIYTPLLILELSPIDFNPKSQIHKIMLMPSLSFSVDWKNNLLIGPYNRSVKLDLFLANGNSTTESKKTTLIWDFLGITNLSNVKDMSPVEFIDTFLFPKYYKKCLYEYLNSPTTAIEELSILDIIKYTENITELNYSNIKNRRVVMGDYLFEKLYNAYYRILLNWTNRRKVMVKFQKRMVMYDGFAQNMHRGGLVDKSIPYSISINKISQNLKGMPSDAKLKREWMSADKSQFGIICPISVSAGSMAKVLYLTDSARVDQFGRLTKDKDSTEILSVQNNSVSFMSSVDTSRANMAAKQMSQLVISKNTQTPYTFNRKHFVKNIYDEIAEHAGKILYVSENIMIVLYKDLIKQTIPVYPFRLLDGVNAIIQKRIKMVGDTFKKGDKLIEYTRGDMKIGYRTRIIWSNFFGYTADDACVISESYAKRSFAEYGETIYIPITTNMVLEKELEENSTIQDILYYLNKDKPHIKFDKVKTRGTVANIKVHALQKYSVDDLICENLSEMITKKQITQQTEYDEVESIMGDDGETFNTYIAIASSKYKFNTTRLTNIKDQYGLNEISDILGLIQIDIVDIIGTGIGDKFTNLYAGKNVVAKIIPDKLMPQNIDTGEVPDLIFNPIGLPRRNNLGVIYESVFGNIVVDIEKTEVKEEFINKLRFVADHFYRETNIDEYNYMVGVCDRIEDTIEYDMYRDKIDADGLTLYFDSFDYPTFTSIMESVKEYCSIFDVDPRRIYKKSRYVIPKETIHHFKKYNTIFEIEDLGYEAMETNNMYLKLSHNSYSKHNSVGLNTNINQSTGVAAGGRKVGGSSHISWMTIAGLLGHKQMGSNTIKEMLTVMSDSTVREKTESLKEYIIAGETHLKNSYSSMTYNYLNQNLKFVGLSFDKINNQEN